MAEVEMKKFSVAIVGGGLAGISLAIALKARNISFTIYEAKGAFTEIGAGINLGPNGLRALWAIDPSLGDNIYAIATRNPPPHEDTWMWLRYGAPTGDHADGDTIMEIKAPPTGTMTMHRQELLKKLADYMGDEHARFNKKLIGYQQDDEGVTLNFADGGKETASILVGCDGIHSVVRKTMFIHDAEISKPHFNQDGAYRAVVPVGKALEVIGETALRSQVMLGPTGYVVHYPVSGGTAVNVGAWVSKEGQTWDRSEWVLTEQGEEFRRDMKDWGPSVQRILALFDPNPPFWATHQHTKQPDNFVDGCVILIGDGAHSMPPHQGGGASQGVEDAYVLAEVLTAVDLDLSSSEEVSAALKAVQEVRRARFLKVQELSVAAGFDWFSFHSRNIERDQLEEWKKMQVDRLQWIWNVDVVEEAEKAKGLMMTTILHTK